jgi:hypothetical protein
MGVCTRISVESVSRRVDSMVRSARAREEAPFANIATDAMRCPYTRGNGRQRLTAEFPRSLQLADLLCTVSHQSISWQRASEERQKIVLKSLIILGMPVLAG